MEQTLSADAHGTVGILPLEGIVSREEVARTPRFVLVDGSNLYHASRGREEGSTTGNFERASPKGRRA